MSDSYRNSMREQIASISGMILAVLSFITAITHFIELLKGNQQTVTWVILAGACVLLFLSLLYILQKKKKVDLGMGQNRDEPAYSPVIRKGAKWGLVLLPVIICIGLVYNHQDRSLTDTGQSKILVTRFEGDGESELVFTTRILEALEEYLGDSVVIDYLNQQISVTEGGSRLAKKLGEEHNADMVIWGYYFSDGEVVTNVELLQSLDKFEYLEPEKTQRRQSYRLDQSANSIDARYKIGDDLTYMSLFISSLVAINQGRFNEADTYLEQAISLHSLPENMLKPGIAQLYRANVLYFFLGRQEEAIGLYGEAIREDSLNLTAWFNMGEALADIGQHEQAIESFNVVIRADSANTWPLLYRGISQHELGYYSDAVDSYDEVLRIDPTDTWALYNRGNSLHALGFYSLAISSYNQVLELDSTDTWVFFNRGQSEYEQGDFIASIRSLNESIRLDSSDAYAFASRGLSELAMKDYEQAVTSYEEAVRLNATEPSFYYNLGIVLNALGRHADAIDQYNDAILLDENHVGAYHNRGNAYADLEQYVEAIASYSEAIRLDSLLEMAYYNRGYAYMAIGDTHRAEQDFNRERLLVGQDRWDR